MVTGSNTATTSDKISETARGTDVYVQDYLFWYENYRDLWEGGRVFEDESGVCGIYGTGWSMSEFSWAIAEGRVKENHVFVLNKTDFFKNHEVQYIIKRRR
jgi:hypothetical protein